MGNTVHDNRSAFPPTTRAARLRTTSSTTTATTASRPSKTRRSSATLFTRNATGIALDYYSLRPGDQQPRLREHQPGHPCQPAATVRLSSTTRVYQPTGDAIDIRTSSSNVTLNNNILWTQAGFDINVDATSQVGFQSDYNDLYVTGTRQARLPGKGRHSSRRQAWFYLVGQDQHSLSVNPQFVNPAGPDGILGYSTDTDRRRPDHRRQQRYRLQHHRHLDEDRQQSADNGEYLTDAAGNGSHVATWSFSGLTPGTTYQVAVTWPSPTPA